ncbi:hypothetical protein QBC38DRAFT_165606 [Podospora fimiseda]|uniref:Uncharacterized protein n=1 Tax=Podospora fimiseda TaxID=252190 RepID=A0AAN7BRE8_9PEZI|nr:hypothetical protein QBC38DRAFT_165606 [Podospora fimiseda]
MFGSLPSLISVAAPAQQIDPKDVPPAIPINFPTCYPRVPDSPETPERPITSLLQSIIRPTDLSIAHLEALGVHIIPDSAPKDLIPDPASLPDFAAWDALSADDAHAKNESTRKRLNNGNLSPGCQTYLDRKRELSISNEAAYRTVRRLPAIKGQPQARLGNAYEFYRHLELLCTYWDDTAKDTSSSEDKPEENEEATTAVAEGDKPPPEEPKYFRTSTGDKMPPDYRHTMITAFLKLVAYDFGCNITAPRVEPRLQITQTFPKNRSARNSYFPSGCTFIFRSPTTREAARAGIVEGPIAAVSARGTTSFPPCSDPSVSDKESILDLARELVSALVTAQHRAREGKAEKRIGDGEWWTTRPRWGGGPGGPIGREIDSAGDAVVGDKDAPPPPKPIETPVSAPSSAPALPGRPRGGFEFGSSPLSRPSSALSPSSSSKGAKRLKKSGNHPMYDNYRMVRPPASMWDKKTKYSAIGRVKGKDYDDIFVISGLFHHLSVLRVRVPDRLLTVLEGGDAAGGWGKLEVRRSKWFDFFQVEDRLEAMQLIWGVMGWMMREEKKEEERSKEGEDVKMAGA